MKQRLDVYLAETQPEMSREKAKALIMEGLVYVNGQKSDKPGNRWDPRMLWRYGENSPGMSAGAG